MSKGVAAPVEGKFKFLIAIIAFLVFLAIMLLFGSQVVSFIVNNMGWKATVRCDPSIVSC